MIWFCRRTFGALAAFTAAAVPVVAQPAPPLPAFVELRLGAMDHDPWSPERGGYDFTGEVLVNVWRTVDSPFYIPRVHFGTTIDFRGKTSLLYSGFTWEVPLFGPLYAEASFGGAANNGYAGSDPNPGHNMIGCNIMFREALGLGAHLDTHWTVTGQIEHSSNANLCRYNRGVTNYGLKVGYAF